MKRNHQGGVECPLEVLKLRQITCDSVHDAIHHDGLSSSQHSMPFHPIDT